MSIWNKILIGIIGVAALALFYMAARTLKTHQYWRELAQKYQRKIKDVQEQNRVLLEGVEKQGEQVQMGIRQRRIELHRLSLDRLRVWSKCDPKVKLNREDGTAEITVAIDRPDAPGIAENTLLYAFEEADVQNKGRYLGEFKVTKSDEKQKIVVMVPASALGPRQIEKLSNAQRPWELYEVLPHDSREVFASLSDKEKEALLPPESLPEYRNEARPLRDYQVLFRIQNVRRALMTDAIDASERDLKLVTEALGQAREQEKAAQQDVATATEDRKAAVGQRDAVAAYLKTLQRDLDTAKTDIDQLLKNNQNMAEQMAKLQGEAARRIDQRSRAMAQSGAGGT